VYPVPIQIIKTHSETLKNLLLLELRTLDLRPGKLFLPAVARDVGTSTWVNAILASLASVTLAFGLFLCRPLALDTLGAVLVELAVLLLDLVLALLCLATSTGTVTQS
jgi:hypothetical protein